MQSLRLFFVMFVSELFKQLSFCKLHIFPLVLMKWLLTCNDSSQLLMAIWLHLQDVLMTLCNCPLVHIAQFTCKVSQIAVIIAITENQLPPQFFYETVWAFIRLTWLPLSPSFEGEFTVVIGIYEATVAVPDRNWPFLLRVRMWCSSISLAGISCVFIINVVVIC